MRTSRIGLGELAIQRFWSALGIASIMSWSSNTGPGVLPLRSPMRRRAPAYCGGGGRRARRTGSSAKILDLAMLLVPGGQERTENEYRMLLEKAGFRLTRVVPTRTSASVIEAIPV